MRMTKDELSSNAVANLVDVEITSLLSDRRVENDLKQEVAKLLTQVCRVACLVGLLYRVEGYIRFYQQLLSEGRVRLLMVPWAAAGSTKPGHYVYEVIKRF